MLDIRKILEYLPHRYPFVLVDRVLEIEPEQRIVALKNVTINEPFFQGHFPGTPVMPGVLIVEAIAQTGGLLFFDALNEKQRGSVVYFMGMDKVKFRQPVVPGDQLIIEVEILKKKTKVLKMAGTASVDGKRVAQAELMATIELG